MTTRTPRDFSKRKDGLRIPDLVRVQRDAYARFLQLDTPIEDRRGEYGLEGLLREVFPIESYDGSMRSSTSATSTSPGTPPTSAANSD